MVTREELHYMIDFLPDSILAASGQAFLDFLKKEDPVLFALLTAAEDDEPETEEERAAVEEILEDINAGRAELIPHEQVARRLMESPLCGRYYGIVGWNPTLPTWTLKYGKES